jgi:dTDP-4-dehydrorhamnose reductase
LKLLVLGASGQLGQELAELCCDRGISAVLASKASCDIADPQQAIASLKAARPDIVVNAAAYTQVDAAESNSALALRVNRDGPGVLAEICAASSLPLIHISTDYVFDGEKPTPYVEQDEVSPVGAYGLSKEAGEREVRSKHAQHVILRTAWVYGRFGKNFLKTMMTLAATRDSLGVVSDQLGTPTATADIAEAILCVAEKISSKNTYWGTYHFAGAAEGSWHDFANDIIAEQAKYTGKKPPIKALTSAEYPTPARRPQNSRLNSDLFASTFGYRAKPWQKRVPSIVEALWLDRRDGRG